MKIDFENSSIEYFQSFNSFKLENGKTIIGHILPDGSIAQGLFYAGYQFDQVTTFTKDCNQVIFGDDIAFNNKKYPATDETLELIAKELNVELSDPIKSERYYISLPYLMRDRNPILYSADLSKYFNVYYNDEPYNHAVPFKNIKERIYLPEDLKTAIFDLEQKLGISKARSLNNLKTKIALIAQKIAEFNQIKKEIL